jgi:hypothetical protein
MNPKLHHCLRFAPATRFACSIAPLLLGVLLGAASALAQEVPAIKPFTIAVPDAALTDLRTVLNAKVGPGVDQPCPNNLP